MEISLFPKMLRYVFVILLVNTGPSFGLPLEQQTGNGTIMIGNLLSELAKGCKNEFVAGIINNKLDECDLGIPPITESSIRCSMFYDASAVLCNLTTNTSKLATDFAVKTKTNQDLSKFCDEAAHFNLPPTRFLTNISEVLHKDTACTIVCADSYILSEDTSFYCKYYKWMLEIVHSQTAPVINTPMGRQVAVDGQKKINDTAVTNVASALEGLPKKNEDKETSSDTNNKVSTNGVDTNQIPVDTAHPESSVAPSGQKKKLNISETALDNTNSSANGGIHIENVLTDTGIGHGIEAPIKGGLDGDEDDQGMEREENEDQGDSDNGGEGVDDIDNMEQKPVHSDKKSVKDKEAPALDSESSRADNYVNTIDEYTDDDDHFFPFFLTAVIVVVVLYVLYHNKNKVGKMFFGLIVEGRQSGRRRTSRGHAYRRLDTLEQAMSANTAAPPSKIIY
ncbi:hypothetical protein MSG28_008044 [Choristoneura fumiferana]|uniref:Uncharacterized protein n=1 Tax=Choristoneura fumiferana TaxID=7141 RepID=A0ACC0J9P4_CHOFU|nr:hypothetical protein MSG28_008044 [Choristoneura fumiferana]